MLRITQTQGPTGYVKLRKGRRCVLFWAFIARRNRIEVMPMEIQEIWLETPTMLFFY